MKKNELRRKSSYLLAFFLSNTTLERYAMTTKLIIEILDEPRRPICNIVAGCDCMSSVPIDGITCNG